MILSDSRRYHDDVLEAASPTPKKKELTRDKSLTSLKDASFLFLLFFLFIRNSPLVLKGSQLPGSQIYWLIEAN